MLKKSLLIADFIGKPTFFKFFLLIFHSARNAQNKKNAGKYGPEIIPYLYTFHAVWGGM